MFDSFGNLYGTTAGGGTGTNGSGTVFELSPSQGAYCQVWCLTVLHNFLGGKHDGSTPNDGVLLEPGTGNIYGETEFGGGSNGGGQQGAGTVYEITP